MSGTLLKYKVLVLVILGITLLSLGWLATHLVIQPQTGNQLGLKAILEVDKSEGGINENFLFKACLVNIGKEPITISHSYPLFTLEIYNAATGKHLRVYPLFHLDILIVHTIQPGESYFYYMAGHELKSRYELTFSKRGNYKIVAIADFHPSYLELSTKGEPIKLRTNYVRIKVI
ncbi:MAG: hypothetical protein DDT23_01337 [candidate division WS2 bacterium]|nr:hypothetical protein [Candidatus Lithacetigena glycinireducens]